MPAQRGQRHNLPTVRQLLEILISGTSPLSRLAEIFTFAGFFLCLLHCTFDTFIRNAVIQYSLGRKNEISIIIINAMIGIEQARFNVKLVSESSYIRRKTKWAAKSNSGASLVTGTDILDFIISP